jgi:hypothetical protein
MRRQRNRSRTQGNQKPKDTRNTGAPSQSRKDSAANPGLETAGSSAEVHTPETSRKCDNADHKNKDWLDYATGFFAFLAAIGGLTAGTAGVYQGWVAHDAERRQMRAYVGVSPAGVLHYGDARNQIFQLIVKNYGQTPAYDMTPFQESVLIQREGNPNPPEPMGCKSISGNPVLSPTQRNISFDFSGNPYSAADNASVEANTEITNGTFHHPERPAFFYFGRLCYKDAFGDEHYTDWCFFAAGDNMVSSNIGTCRTHNGSN